ncbi:MAG: efflux RND transporter permease subunit [Nitrospirales bacterium]|nr:efflux RND transporter permease subunit [Nitrospirales bacterium]
MATGIYLLDKIEQERAEGKPRREAIISGGTIRLIPVLMTAITFTAAFIPPMFAPPTGMDRFRPIATALIGAMISSTALSLIMVPVTYSLLDDAKEYLQKVFGARPAPAEVEPSASPTLAHAVAEPTNAWALDEEEATVGRAKDGGARKMAEAKPSGSRTGAIVMKGLFLMTFGLVSLVLCCTIMASGPAQEYFFNGFDRGTLAMTFGIPSLLAGGYSCFWSSRFNKGGTQMRKEQR